MIKGKISETGIINITIGDAQHSVELKKFKMITQDDWRFYKKAGSDIGYLYRVHVLPPDNVPVISVYTNESDEPIGCKKLYHRIFADLIREKAGVPRFPRG